MTNSSSITYIIPFWSGTSRSSLHASLSSLVPDRHLITSILLACDGCFTLDDSYISCIPYLFRSLIDFVFISVNRGPGYARNYAASVATSEFVFFLDAGDINIPGRTQAQLDILKSYSFSYGAISETISVDSPPISRRLPVLNSIMGSLLLPFRNPFNNVSLACHRSDFLRLGGYANLRIAEDWVLSSRILSSSFKVHVSDHDFVLVVLGNSFYARRGGFMILRELTTAYLYMMCIRPLCIPLFIIGLFLTLISRFLFTPFLPILYKLFRRSASR